MTDYKKEASRKAIEIINDSIKNYPEKWKVVEEYVFENECLPFHVYLEESKVTLTTSKWDLTLDRKVIREETGFNYLFFASLNQKFVEDRAKKKEDQEQEWAKLTLEHLLKLKTAAELFPKDNV